MKKLFILMFILVSVFSAYSGEKEKYYAPTMTSNFILYALDPNRVAGWCLRLKDYEIRFMDKNYSQLPVLGGWFRGGVPDKELILKTRVKKAFVISQGDNYTLERLEELEKFNMEITHYRAKSLEDFIPLLRQAGKDLGIPERGEELAKYGEEAIAKTKAMVANIPEHKRLRVFLGAGDNAQSAACKSEILDIVGAVSVYKCSDTGGVINFEQIVMYDPDAIIIANPSGKRVFNDPKWKRLRAFREGRVYLTPYGPFSWFHMPEITRFMGIQWLACTLYPDNCTIDINSEAKRFTKLFFHKDITDEELDVIMHRDNK